MEVISEKGAGLLATCVERESIGSGAFGVAYIASGANGRRYAVKHTWMEDTSDLELHANDQSKWKRFSPWNAVRFSDWMVGHCTEEEQMLFTRVLDWRMVCETRKSVKLDEKEDALVPYEHKFYTLQILMDYKSDGPLFKGVSKLEERQRVVGLTQILHALSVMRRGGWLHNDAHAGNILITTVKPDTSLKLELVPGKGMVKLPTLGVVFSLADYDFCTHHDVNNPWFSIFSGWDIFMVLGNFGVFYLNAISTKSHKSTGSWTAYMTSQSEYVRSQVRSSLKNVASGLSESQQNLVVIVAKAVEDGKAAAVSKDDETQLLLRSIESMYIATEMVVSPGSVHELMTSLVYQAIPAISSTLLRPLYSRLSSNLDFFPLVRAWLIENGVKISG